MTQSLITRLREAEGAIADTLIRVVENGKITIHGEHQCWEWSHKSDPRGRAKLSVSGKQWLAHRAMWTALKGEIPKGAFVCHHCDNATCVNPEHMYIGDHASNMRDMKVRKRYFAASQPERAAQLASETFSSQTHTRGTGNPKAKLAESQVKVIRSSTEKTKILAERYGVHRTTIQRIRKGTLWNS